MTPFDNCYPPAFDVRNTTQSKWGKDQTGIIQYQFNNQGFRGDQSYNWVCDYAFFGNSAVFGIGVPFDKTMVSYFSKAHNYGLAGPYMNWHSVKNLKKFLNSALYTTNTKIIFVWIDRPGRESVPELIDQVNQMQSGILHISMGNKYPQSVNLMPSIDHDVSGTHPGTKSHAMWAKTIQLLLNKC